MSFTYLLIDFFTIIVPFIYSFHPKLQFYKTWKAFFPAVLLTGLIFVLWDVYFTSLGVWGFNPRYLIGIKLGNMPLEEILFFLCIPYACVFTFHCLDLFIKRGLSKATGNILTPVCIIAFIIVAFIHHDKIYPMVTFSGLAFLLIFAKYILKLSWLNKFYIIYAILLIPFVIVNGILTGTGLDAPVVWYNAQEIIGFRILTIPIEDTFYGMGLILSNLMIYKYLKKNVRL
jgi:lycopene cyclase domain-containing protein